MKKAYCIAFILLLLSMFHYSYASIVLERTRLIYPADAHNIMLQIVNYSDQSTLIQSWIDEGDMTSTPETTTAPFIVIPPMAKISANSGLQLKIQQLENQLPKDRESVFYLNVVDITPKPVMRENLNTLQLALHTRIKLFYRPMQLKLKTEDIFKLIEITYNDHGLEINNPTAYFFTIAKISMGDENGEQMLHSSIMIAPFSQQHIQYTKQIDNNKNIIKTYIDNAGHYQQGKMNIKQ